MRVYTVSHVKDPVATLLADDDQSNTSGLAEWTQWSEMTNGVSGVRLTILCHYEVAFTTRANHSRPPPYTQTKPLR